MLNPDLVELSTILSSSDPEILSDDTLWNSAVCLLLYPKDGDYCILFNKRTELVEFNKGDICFPGGAQDPEDSHLTDITKREVFEEMGIKVEDITLIGDLSETRTRAGFRIHPFVGTIPYPYEFNPSTDEVAEVLEVPIKLLLNPENYEDKEEEFQSRVYFFNNHIIWGATARMLKQFLDIILKSGWTKRI